MCIFLFFRQKTAYDMRISDWSSDVCSSDLRRFDLAVDHRLQRRQRDRAARLVVEMARDDVAVVEKLRLRIDGDEIADIDAESLGSAAIVALGVDADLDLAPSDRLRFPLHLSGSAGGFPRKEGGDKGRSQ